MKDAAAIVAYVESLIAHIYRRPGMYGVTAAEIDTLLYHLHTLWLEIHERNAMVVREFVRDAHGDGHQCNFGFAGHFRHCVPGGREAGETANRDRVVATWRRLDASIGLGVRELSGSEGTGERPV